MDENLHKDPLEELFRKKLEDQNLENKSASPDEWDLPADSLWDNIGPAVEFTPPAKGLWLSSKLQLVAIAASILLVIGVFTCFQSYQTQLNSLTQKVEELSSQKELKNSSNPEETKASSKDNPSTDAPTESKLSEPALNKQESKTNIASSSEAPIITENTNSNPTTPPNASLDKKDTDRSNKPSNTPIVNNAGTTTPPPPTDIEKAKEQESADQQNTTWIATAQSPATSPSSNPIIPEQDKLPLKDSGDQTSNTNATIAWTALPTLPTSSIALLDQKPASIVLPKSAKPSIITPASQLARKGFYVGLLYAPTATFIEVQAPKRHPSKPGLKKGKIIPTSFQGLKLGYQINSNWAIEIEGLYSNATIEDKTSFQLSYSKQKERKEGQLYRGNYNSSIPTAYGDLDTEIVLYREENTNIPEQTDINVDLTTKQNLQLLSIPIAAKYRFGRGPIRLTARAGIAANFILEDQVELSVSSIDRLGLSSRNEKYKPVQRGLGKNNFDYLLGIGLDFQAAKNWRFSVEPSFSRAFGPIYKKDKFSATPKKASVALSANYQF